MRVFAAKKNRILILLIFAALIVAPCGRVLAAKKIALDIVNKPVYQNMDAKTLIGDFDKDPEAAAQKYKGRHFAVLGRYKGSGSDETLVITPAAGGNGELVCTKNTSSKYEYTPAAGDAVWVYGKYEDGGLFNKNKGFTVDNIRKSTANTAYQSVFSLADGSSVDKRSMKKRTIEKVGFSYLIPGYFEDVEEELLYDNEMLGYQYKLNHLDGSGAPERLFVFCVDEYYLKDRGDIKKDADVQKAIIKNIVGGSKILNKNIPLLSRDYDRAVIKGDHATFANYSGTYKAGECYLEFMFPESGDRQYQTCFLYVYHNEKHAGDILLMLEASMAGEK